MGISTISATFAVRWKDSTCCCLAQVPRRDGEHHQAPGDERREDHVRVAPHEGRVHEQRPDVVQHRLAGLVELVADGVLHPRVRDQDEHAPTASTRSRRPRSSPGAPASGSRFQPNSHSPRNVDSRKNASQALHRQRRAEHAADEARVGGPVHPELELLNQSGDHADRHVDQQQRPEEARHPLVLGVVRPIPGGLQDRHQERQPDRHRARTGSGRCSWSRTASARGRWSSSAPCVAWPAVSHCLKSLAPRGGAQSVPAGV